MHSSDYYRDQANYYRLLAGSAENDADKQEFLDLAKVCEETIISTSGGRVDSY